MSSAEITLSLVESDFHPETQQVSGNPVLIQTLISKSAVEAFDTAILGGLARFNQSEFHLFAVGPLI